MCTISQNGLLACLRCLSPAPLLRNGGGGTLQSLLEGKGREGISVMDYSNILSISHSSSHEITLYEIKTYMTI